MKDNFVIVSIMFLLAFSHLVFCEETSESIGDSYLPLTVGSYWVYQEVVNLRSESNDIEEKIYKKICTITSVDKFKDFIVVVQEEKSAEGDAIFLFIKKDNKIFGIFASEENINSLFENENFLNSVTPFWVIPICEGYKEEIIINNESNEKIIYSVERADSIKIPAGEFKNCFLINIISIDLSISKFWLYPDIGIIKYEFQNEKSTIHATGELEKYEIMP